MDIQLKQRLLGAIIVLALAVVFVPMLFNKHQKEQALRERAIPSLPAQPVTNDTPPSVASQEAQVESLLSSDTSLGSSTEQTPTSANQSVVNLETQGTPSANEPASLEIKLQSENGETVSPVKMSVAANTASPVLPPVATSNTSQQDNSVSSNDHKSVEVETTSDVALTLPKKEQAQLTHTSNTAKASKSSLSETQAHAKSTGESVNQRQHSSKVLKKKFTEPYYVRSNLASSNNVHLSELVQLKQQQKQEKKALLKAKQHTESWIIQMGSFSTTNHASQLVKSLRRKGFTAFSYGNVNKGGELITKVYVGPFVQKSEAQSQLLKIKTVMKLTGFVSAFDAKDLH